jgi:hypothetical protein
MGLATSAEYTADPIVIKSVGFQIAKPLKVGSVAQA